MATHNGQAIILASSSPRRQELLKLFRLSFTVKPSHVDESVDQVYKPARLVELLAERKASQIAGSCQEGLVIGSDTVVVLDEEVLGKPSDEREAYEMLSKLSGREHSVFSGLAVINAKDKTKRIGHVETRVKMKILSEREIRSYIATKEPMDKAGSYAIQGIGSLFVEEIHGDYFSVVGLPVRLLSEFLADYGVDVLA